MAKYDPDNDIYAIREYKRDYAKLIIQNQSLSPSTYKREFLHVKNIEAAHYKQFTEAFALKNPGLYLTTLGFAYIGGLYQARKQFINGGDYFLNAKFNFVGGYRPILLGLTLGFTTGVFIFGNNALLKDTFNTFLSGLHKIPREERANDQEDVGFYNTSNLLRNTIYDR